MAGELLLDTGALVSLLDRSQTHHAEFAKFFERWRGPFILFWILAQVSSSLTIRSNTRLSAV